MTTQDPPPLRIDARLLLEALTFYLRSAPTD